jgi:hypothetical protein
MRGRVFESPAGGRYTCSATSAWTRCPWARRGALVSGLDFSAPAIEAASALAAELGIDASFVVSDEYDFDVFGRFESLQRQDDGTYRFLRDGPGFR